MQFSATKVHDCETNFLQKYFVFLGIILDEKKPSIFIIFGPSMGEFMALVAPPITPLDLSVH